MLHYHQFIHQAPTGELTPQIKAASFMAVRNNNQLKGTHLMQQYDLSPQYDSRSSFYGKARVSTMVNGDLNLISYTTHVATIMKHTNKAVVFGTYSATTLRHIKEFLLQNGFKAENSKQIMADYGVQR